jgi:hypothetical protein
MVESKAPAQGQQNRATRGDARASLIRPCLRAPPPVVAGSLPADARLVQGRRGPRPRELPRAWRRRARFGATAIPRSALGSNVSRRTPASTCFAPGRGGYCRRSSWRRQRTRPPHRRGRRSSLAAAPIPIAAVADLPPGTARGRRDRRVPAVPRRRSRGSPPAPRGTLRAAPRRDARRALHRAHLPPRRRGRGVLPAVAAFATPTDMG